MAWTTVVVLSFLAIVSYVYTLRLLSLKSLPGPFLARLSGLYRIYLLWSGQPHLKMEELHRRYGPVVITGPRHAIISDPSALATIYGTGWRYRKTEFYRVFALVYKGTIRDTVFSTRDAEYHSRLRLHVAKRFTVSSLKACEFTITQCTRVFLERMGNFQGKPVDLAAWAKYWAFDVNSAVILSHSFGFLEKGGDIRGIIQGVDEGFHYGALVGQMPWLNSCFFENKFFMKLLAVIADVPDPTTDIVELIEERMSMNPSKPSSADECLLSWLREEQAKGRNDLDDASIVIHLANYFVAGSVTTATSVGAVLYHIVKNPAVYSKLTTEVRSTASTTLSPTKCMSYLQAVIKETMRLSPTNNIPLERIVPREGLIVNNLHLPENTVVGISGYIIHRNREIFGDNADVFRPERWLDADGVRLSQMNKHFFAFGKGERGCTGRVLAIMMVETFVAQVLQRFEVEWAGPHGTWDLKSWWMPVQRKLHLRFTPVKPLG